MNPESLAQYNTQFHHCRDIFAKKTKDYGTSWRVLRPHSLTDQLFIKAQRIKTIEQGNIQRVDEGVEVEFVGIVNYAVIALMQLQMSEQDPMELPEAEALDRYDFHRRAIRELMLAKNHDYGEAWRDMRISSFTDLILMKLLRIKQIEDNRGKTLISEGVDSGYRDIANYALFALIQLSEKNL